MTSEVPLCGHLKPSLRPNITALVRYPKVEKINCIEEVHCEYFMAPHFRDFCEQMPDTLLVDMVIHTFDAARFIMNADPSHVYCRPFRPLRTWYKGDASAVAVFEMRAVCSIAVYSATMGDRPPGTAAGASSTAKARSTGTVRQTLASKHLPGDGVSARGIR